MPLFMTFIALKLLLPINFKKNPSGRSLVVFSCSLNWEKKISAKLVHSGGLNWIEQFWIKLRPIVDELTENTLYLVCFIFSWRWFKLVCTIWTISEMLCFLQIVGTVAIKFVPREVIVWISSGSAQNHFDYRVYHGNPWDQQKSKFAI